MWDEWNQDYREKKGAEEQQQQQQQQQESYLNSDFLSVNSKPKNYYKLLELDFEAKDDDIRSNFIRLALKWHPDKQKNQDNTTTIFQEINEAYQVLSDPSKRREYDQEMLLQMYDYNIIEYLNRYKGFILTCNGLGIKHTS
ncbi:protein tumorous imaginal discs, mitochondrial-like [Impatiens glandulifera]|uniref:protein tumorous imaginal discs, mitochondrial-like n=1 Tax=Impatiens glandulifera TaxID=253017 RepID=UPI001FB189AC|nr:protein tumorous imaginal discs, mitochondrial-like [Impatiens glandulifera]XP_047323444.1 protein tumorous imaginal discs, mitochondrial-like [Impatiens glandulifera]